MKGALKYLLISSVFSLIAGFLFTVPQEVIQEEETVRTVHTLDSIPNYNYVPDIKALKAENKLNEALELARFVLRDADMPGQEEAELLKVELEKSLSSPWTRAKRVSRGFVIGSGNSIEEISGGIASDLIIWGDIRDLCKQGYYKVTGKETDPVIAALAGVGLATQAVHAVDWAPAVLKAFRKVGALSREFMEFLITERKKFGGLLLLKPVFKDVQFLADKMGLARTAAVFKHIDDPTDLAAITTVAQKNVDSAYLTVKNGGKDGVGFIKRLGDTDEGVATLTEAAKKGPEGIRFLKRSEGGREYVITARVLKNIRLNRPQKLIAELAKKHPAMMKTLRTIAFLSATGALITFVAASRKLYEYLADCTTVGGDGENL